ncbi:flagellar hook-associated protein 1 FlgK [Tistlia consotensis]|uniref:Flagellar hook-associated protein 1 n=1 Tax=Tistlia consotensis USBA 355 TaxID=560819 RepID=A0A1Y6B9W2_9PROT|nr:flagellar hook-associated protein FlgK [Tistlia consotensis]SME96917.1 flagellar hook-associated protein 1 FlgK [Tistlia consotensis USBA 355]SNR56316.1 flagellar hook-associated protein 1 FlgK [Tistlia consotensis]
MTSLGSATSAAFSALQAASYGMKVTSANVANASVEGYTAKTAALSTQVTDGLATGVTATTGGAGVDAALVRSIASASAAAGASAVASTALDGLVDLLGSASDSNDLASLISDLGTAASDLQLYPESQSSKASFLSAADALAERLNALSDGVQQARADADQGIEDGVDQANALLEKIDGYNRQIAEKTAQGESTDDLEDLRRSALVELSGVMDVTYFTNSSNELQIYTGSGTALLTSTVHELSYSAAGSVTSATSFGGITVDGKDITGEIDGGSIGGNIALRDETLPEVQAELDSLAQALGDTLNAVTNAGSAYPAPSSLTSSGTLGASDALSGSGTVRILLTDSDGTVDQVLDLDLSGLSTVQDLIDSVDAVEGLSASIVDGKLVLSADDASQGVALVALDGTLGGDGDSLSGYFGFNDLFTGSDAQSIAVNADWLDDPSLLPTGTGSDSASLAAGDSALSSGDTTTVDAVLAQLDASLDFAAAGALGGVSESLSDYAADIVSQVALAASNADDRVTLDSTLLDSQQESFSNSYGVSLDEEALAMSAYQDAYSAASTLISTLQEMFQALLNAVD